MYPKQTVDNLVASGLCTSDELVKASRLTVECEHKIALRERANKGRELQDQLMKAKQAMARALGQNAPASVVRWHQDRVNKLTRLVYKPRNIYGSSRKRNSKGRR